MPQVVIANSLADGFVVFLTADGHWSRQIDDAAQAEDEAAAEALLGTARQAEQANEVIDPYLITVTQDDNEHLRPVEYREFIRAYGPSVPPPGHTDN